MKTLPIFLLLLCSFSVFAQSPHLFCKYKETYTPDSLKRERKQEDLMGLEIAKEGFAQSEAFLGMG